MLDKLLVCEGVAVEESSIYLECDEDFQKVPSYSDGREGAELIPNWFVENEAESQVEILAKCAQLIELFA